MYTDHFAAVKERLEDSPRLAGKVFDVVRRNENGEFVRANYIVLTAGIPETGEGRHPLAADDNTVFDFPIRAVGTSADAVMKLLDEVHAQFFGWVPDVQGRRCTSMRYPRQRVEIRAETSVRPPLYFADVEWTLRSNKAQQGS